MEHADKRVVQWRKAREREFNEWLLSLPTYRGSAKNSRELRPSASRSDASAKLCYVSEKGSAIGRTIPRFINSDDMLPDPQGEWVKLSSLRGRLKTEEAQNQIAAAIGQMERDEIVIEDMVSLILTALGIS